MSVIVEKNTPVPMRDGVQLRADVYRPQAAGLTEQLAMKGFESLLGLARQ